MADNRPFPQNPYNNSPYPDESQGAGYAASPYQNFPQPTDPYGSPGAYDPYGYGDTSPTNSATYPSDPYTSGAGGSVYDPYAGEPDQNQYTGSGPTGFNPNNPSAAHSSTPGYPEPNTFQEKKTGNKLLLSAIVGVIVLLVIAAIALIIINVRNPQGNVNPGNSDNNQKIDENAQFQPNIAKTGGPNSPATLARKSSNVNLPAAWILQKFQGQPYIDAQGRCLNDNRCGPNADPDDDGVTNIEEFNFGLDPLNSDTDRDGIADGDELYVYFTDPTKPDSDGDGYDDFTEIVNCYSPVDSTKGAKMVRKNPDSVLDLSRIEANVELNPLKAITQNSFRRANATREDLARGYIASACTPPTQSNNPGPTDNSSLDGPIQES